MGEEVCSVQNPRLLGLNPFYEFLERLKDVLRYKKKNSPGEYLWNR